MAARSASARTSSAYYRRFGFELSSVYQIPPAALPDPRPERMPAPAARVSVQEAPGEDPPPLVIHNDRARTELGWRPRPVETTIVESAECLRDLGLLEERYRRC
ncbi:MAG: hypothetical protein ACRDPF_05095 [Streptosporangiaceae bacterium]